MYSVVLLMALGGGGEAPALGHHASCSGCTGYAGCSDCCGGYAVTCGGCSGGTGWSACCGGCSGCCGGCTGWAAYPACTGCTGSGDCQGSKHHFFGKHRHGHDSCHGCCGGCHGTAIPYDTGGGCSGCCGGTVAVPATQPVEEAPRKELAPQPKEVRSPAAPTGGATFVTEPTPALGERLPADPAEGRPFGSRILGRLRGTSAP
jgi:hypothetical protein